MTDERFERIDRLVEDAGRCFDPVTGLFESVGDDEETADMDLDPAGFLALLGVTAEECVEYVQRKLRDYDESFRNA